MKNKAQKNVKLRKQKIGKRRISIQILLNLAIIVIIFLIFSVNIPLYPKEGMHIRSNNVNFEWIGMGTAKLADNSQFILPIEVKKGMIIELKPDIYYWKVGFGRTHSFVIDSEVTVAVTPQLMSNETKYRIENKGNTKILLRIIGMITGKVVLEPNAVVYQENISQIEKISASENEK